MIMGIICIIIRIIGIIMIVSMGIVICIIGVICIIIRVIGII